MALYQDNNREIRYLNNTEREQKIIGNYYRDIIRQYGVDVNYYKLRIPYMEQFKTIVDENAVLRHAYGYEEEPDYSISAQMISYLEVQDDILQLDKYGIIPNTTVNFWFDREDFACALAQKMGQLREYRVKETEFVMEVPECLSDTVMYKLDAEGNPLSDEVTQEDLDDPEVSVVTQSLSDDIFPYALGYNVPETFETEILSGHFAVQIEPYVIGPDGHSDEKTVLCRIVDHGDVKLEFPTNEWTANSFKRKVRNDDFVETMLFLTYSVERLAVGGGEFRYILHGKLHGGVLFNDLTKVGKYADLIHPDVGDVVTIGFPSKNARQQYEITECTDKRMSNDGINPLLGKYVWLCRAKRRVDNDEGVPERNEDDERLKEGIDFLNNADEIIAKKIADYDEQENDAVYGGYERDLTPHDRNVADLERPERNPKGATFVDDGSWIGIFRFHDGSMLVTDGYELDFVDKDLQAYRVATGEAAPEGVKKVPTDLQYLKATDNALYFVNAEGVSNRICEDESVTKGEVEMCLNSLVDATVDMPDHNRKGQCFYKFRESNTVLISLSGGLYCRFGNAERKVVRLV